jgi:DNA-binding PadR family transcriptional regulator
MSGSSGELPELGRFSEPALLILVSLAGGDKHGYAMIEDIEQLTGMSLGPGTLYGALARLERRGWIESLQSNDRRRPYRLTGAGASALRERLSGMRDFAAAGLQRLAIT